MLLWIPQCVTASGAFCLHLMGHQQGVLTAAAPMRLILGVHRILMHSALRQGDITHRIKFNYVTCNKMIGRGGLILCFIL